MAIINPGFEEGDSGWTKGTSWTIVQNSGFSRDGTWAAQWDGGNGASSEIINDVREPVTAGQSVTASMYGSTNGAGVTQGGVVVMLVWYNASGTRLGKTEGNIIRGGGTSLHQSTVTGTAPSGAVTVSVGANAYRNSNPRPYYVDTFTWNIVRDRTITLIQPTAGQEFSPEQQIPLRVEIGGTAPAITSVSYLVDGVEERVATAAPYGVNLAPLSIGAHTVQARLNLVDGTTVLSNVVNITVAAIPTPPTLREFSASNSYTYLIGENFINLGGAMPPTARVLGVEVIVDYTMEVLVRSKDLGIADPAEANYDIAFSVVNGGTVEAVLLNNTGTSYMQLGAPMSNTIAINRSDFTVTEDGTSEGKRWTTLSGGEGQVVVGAEDQRFGLLPEFGSTFIDYGVGIRFTPNLASVPVYADEGDACYRFNVQSFKVRVYFDAGSVEYYFASADKTQVLKGTLAAYYVYTGNFTTSDATGVLQLTADLEQMDGTQRWIGSDWTIHSSYPPTDSNQIGEVGEVEEGSALGMKYNGLPTQQQVRDNRSRYEFKTENFYGSAELNSFYGVHGLARAFSYNGDFFYKIYTQADAEKDQPRHVANHHGHLALGFYGGRVDISVTGEPYNFNGVDGASSWAFGDKVVGLLPLSGTILGVFGAKSVWGISGTTVDNFATQVISPNMGAVEYTITDMGFPVYANSYGIYTLNQTQQYGDYLGQPMSQDISPWLRPRLIRKLTSDKEVVCAFPVRSKNQYRLCFSDGYVTSMTLNGQQVPTFSFQKYFYTAEDVTTPEDLFSYEAIVPAAVSSELDEAGEERIHIASYEDAEIIPTPLDVIGEWAEGKVEISYNSSLQAIGFSSLFSFMQVGGEVPPGLTLSLNRELKQIVMTGVPTQAGNYSFSIRVFEPSGRSVVKTLPVLITVASVLVGMRHASNNTNQVLYQYVNGAWEILSSDKTEPWVSIGPLRSMANYLLGRTAGTPSTLRFMYNSLVGRTSYNASDWINIQRFDNDVYFYAASGVGVQVSRDRGLTAPIALGGNWGNYRLQSIARLPTGRWVAMHQSGSVRTALYSDEATPLTWISAGAVNPGEVTNQRRLLSSAPSRVFYISNITGANKVVSTTNGEQWQDQFLFDTSLNLTTVSAVEAWADGVCIHITTSGQVVYSLDGAITWAVGPTLALGGIASSWGGTLTRSGNRILFCGGNLATNMFYTDNFGVMWTALPAMPLEPSGQVGAPSCVFTNPD